MIRSLVAGVLTLSALALASPGTAGAQAPEPYRDPPFTCEVIDYGTEAPTLPAPADDPLCVRYDKTNITLSTLEVVDFLAAEPGRVGVAAAKCSYWQQDHWIVRMTPEWPPVVEWEGSYWYDVPTGSGGAVLRGLRVGGQPADGSAFIEAMRPLVGDERADEMATYASSDGGGGMTFVLPDGFGAGCASPAPGEPDPDPSPSTTQPSPAPTVLDERDQSGGGGAALPATGAATPLVTVMAMVGAGLVTRGLARLGRAR